MKKQIKISIIVPVYNVEKYLKQCIESIIKQSYTNLEIILVNDGSKDRSGEICDNYAKLDNRIIVIHKENAGLGYARNSGLDNATGDYVYFVDSDDYIDLDLVKKCVDQIKLYKPDIVMFGAKKVDSYGNILSKRIPDDTIRVYENNQIEEIIIPNILGMGELEKNNIHIGVSACVNFISLNLINKINWRFVSEREIISEDAYSILTLYKYVKRVSLIGEAFYNYRMNENSLTHVYRSDRFEKNKIFYIKTLELCNKLNYSDKVKSSLSIRFFNNIIGIFKLIICSKLNIKLKYYELKKILCDEQFQFAIEKIDLSKETRIRKILLRLVKKRNIILVYILTYINLNFKKKG